MAASLLGCVQRSLWQPTCIRQQCNHEEMPGKCFNLPVLIQNATTLNQAGAEQIFQSFLGPASAAGVCTALSPFLLSGALWHWPRIAAYITEILCLSAGPKQHVFVKYSLHTLHSTVRNTPLTSASVLPSKAPDPLVKLHSGGAVFGLGRLLGMTACDCAAGRYCERAHVLSTTLPG